MNDCFAWAVTPNDTEIKEAKSLVPPGLMKLIVEPERPNYDAGVEVVNWADTQWDPPEEDGWSIRVQIDDEIYEYDWPDINDAG